MRKAWGSTQNRNKTLQKVQWCDMICSAWLMPPSQRQAAETLMSFLSALELAINQSRDLPCLIAEYKTTYFSRGPALQLGERNAVQRAAQEESEQTGLAGFPHPINKFRATSSAKLHLDTRNSPKGSPQDRGGRGLANSSDGTASPASTLGTRLLHCSGGNAGPGTAGQQETSAVSGRSTGSGCRHAAGWCRGALPGGSAGRKDPGELRPRLSAWEEPRSPLSATSSPAREQRGWVHHTALAAAPLHPSFAPPDGSSCPHRPATP
ncbi:PREDICTED: uncharacterized protein LOC102026473 [Chinchilla lanigera]|uniref:uncharacterized protein LOC102026473 n=1 Tax=Chinchilla lanigera TaxID=34839 RepID=UPI00038ED2A9|nr:PREDICTED: uncharacterized protein LOC102026473 [Chinchilla lanigera]